MASIPTAGPRVGAFFLGGAFLLACAAPVAADPKPLSKEEQAKVDEAIDKGVAFLKKAQTKEGDFDWKMIPESHFVGQCALPAYALLESGVPADDPVIQKAADYLRPRVLRACPKWVSQARSRRIMRWIIATLTNASLLSIVRS